MSATSTMHPLAAVTSPDGWSTSLAVRARMAHDASHYLLTPEAVATPKTVPELVAMLSAAHRTFTPVAFRAGGTSLSGQCGTDGVLIDIRRHFQDVEILDDGARVRCAPGAVLRRVNNMLARYGRKLGPDPASEIACTIGGVVANNSSGMTSSVAATAYRTIESMVYVLPTGTLIDTAAPDADRKLAELEPALHEGITQLRDHVRSRPELRAKIEQQFAMKNTMGYAVNALLDYDEVADILAHLLVGSEGTLGYVASVVLRTFGIPTQQATTLLTFSGIEPATEAIPGLLESGARAVELMDAGSLRVAQALPGSPPAIQDLHVADHTSLLVEYQCGSEEDLAQQMAAGQAVIGNLSLAAPAEFTRDRAARASLWLVRKGLYAAVAGAREVGTTNLLEDIAVPPAALTDTVRELGGLFDRHGYSDAVTFGHARDANLHFMITPHLDDAGELATYEAFTEDMVDLVLSHEGTLKAEHGTGRIMSAYVERQYGPELYAVMRKIKSLCDPHAILGPGIIINDDPRAHMQHLKIIPQVDPAVDKCVDCGFCEPACPSRNTTTTPRQRIALMREAAGADAETRAAIEEAFDYDAVDTCAADSLCVRACPVGIDTGKVMKAFRATRHNEATQRAGTAAAKNWAPIGVGIRNGIKIADGVPSVLPKTVTSALRKVITPDWLPLVGDDLPRPGKRRSQLAAEAVPSRKAGPHQPGPQRGNSDSPAPVPTPDVLFFPSCTGAMFGPAGGGEGAASAFIELCEMAGLSIALVPGIDGLCCGTPWESKGLVAGHRQMARQVFDAVDSVLSRTKEGPAPVLVCDAASCTHGIEGLGNKLDPLRAAIFDQWQIQDAVEFVEASVLPKLDITEAAKADSLVIHPTCSTEHLGIGDQLRHVAEAAAKRVEVPPSWGCCGFAGDRGMLHPELTKGATEAEAREINTMEEEGGNFTAYASCNRTCEMGMSRATGRDYEHVLEVLVRAARASVG